MHSTSIDNPITNQFEPKLYVCTACVGGESGCPGARCTFIATTRFQKECIEEGLPYEPENCVLSGDPEDAKWELENES